jgi:NAD(P)-dependent dehydrogenase (short-subunit alcohol dehydrogenase family)
MRFNGSTALVIGGASGLGESMGYALAKEGASIVVDDRNIDGADAVVSNADGVCLCVWR